MRSNSVQCGRSVKTNFCRSMITTRKLQAPTSKLQRNSKHQIPIQFCSSAALGPWSFFGCWKLELGASQELPPFDAQILRHQLGAQVFVIEHRKADTPALEGFVQFAQVVPEQM